ncbi:Mus7/MMS22 family-domain-containing protein [Rhizoctonia solani]|nr:Mus7/MMS22 family-domain-containing protein [Rhizoctonia solani]
MRILNRMMPTAWIRRQMEQKEAKKHSDHQKRRILPPTGGTKRNLGNLQKPLVLMGDSESEEEVNTVLQDDDQPVLLPIPSSPLTHSPVRSAVFTSRRRKAQVLSSDDNDGDIIEVSSSDERSISSSAIVPKHMDDDEISSWLTRRSPVRSGGGDLINRMLSRTGEFSRNPKRTPKKQRAGYKQDGTKMKQAKLTSIFRVIELSSDDDKPKAKRVGSGIHLDLSRKQASKQPRSQRTFTIRSDWAELLDGTVAASTDARRAKDKKTAYNRTASTSHLHIREGQGQPPGSQNSPTRRRTSKGHPFDHKSVSTDCGVLPFDPHTKFTPSTYIGRGFLQNLVNAVMTADTPSVEAAPVVVFGEHLDTRISGPDFVEKWTDWLLGQKNETEQNVQRSFRYVALTMTHLLEGSASSHLPESGFSSASLDFLEEDAAEILTLINVVSQGDPSLKDASIESSASWLSFHWFLVRLPPGSFVISVSAELDSAMFDAAVQLLIRALLSYSISDRLQQSYNSTGDLSDLVLELWVCLIHLVDETRVAGATNWKPLWTRVEQVLDSSVFALPYKVFESERRWEHIFAFSALNMFSSQTGRLMPSHPPISRWSWVCKTIKDVRLKEDNAVAGTSTRQQRIDFYVRTVMARCWLLHTMWGWNYQHYDRLFTLIYPIFQSRKLAKLRDEKTDFPPFIRHLDLESLDRFSNGDSAWSVFLKVFRSAIIDDPSGARKLYSTCIPIGVLNFTDENPATDIDLSRLLNRFAILLVVLITDPTPDRATDCVKRIQALISFQAADMRSREACIRAFQYAGLLLKFYKLDFTPLVSWMRNMVTTLQEGMTKASSLPQRNRLAVLVLCLLRGVASIVSTAGFNRDTELEYPETGFLIPELFQLVFQLDVKSNPAARREIRLFLEALCNAREAYIARLPPKPVALIVQDEESQENYGFDDFDLDLNDPDVLAGLDAIEGDAALPVNNSDTLAVKERSTAELVNTTVSPAIFENVILGFGLDDRRLSGAPERENDTSEEYAWVKVWVGCLKIVVDNYLRTWWDYLGNWGGSQQERISRIIDIAAERRVRIQFCYLALKCSPNLVQRASREHKHQLILPWFQCLPHHRYTVEHKYTALICDRGLTSNPMLEGLPCRANEKGEHYVLSTELMTERLEYIRRVLQNLSRLASANRDNPMSTDVTRGREYIAKLFETMKHTREHLGRPFASSADHNLIPSYLGFCHSVREIAVELLLEASVKDLCLRLSWVPQPS